MPDLMQLMVSERAEALHIYPGAAPVLEVKRVLHRLQGVKVTTAETDSLLHAVTGADKLAEFAREGLVSFSFHLRAPGGAASRRGPPMPLRWT